MSTGCEHGVPVSPDGKEQPLRAAPGLQQRARQLIKLQAGMSTGHAVLKDEESSVDGSRAVGSAGGAYRRKAQQKEEAART